MEQLRAHTGKRRPMIATSFDRVLLHVEKLVVTRPLVEGEGNVERSKRIRHLRGDLKSLGAAAPKSNELSRDEFKDKATDLAKSAAEQAGLTSGSSSPEELLFISTVQLLAAVFDFWKEKEEWKAGPAR